MRTTFLMASIVAGATVAASLLPARADATSDGLAKAKANLVAYTAKPVFTAPGPDVRRKDLRGRKEDAFDPQHQRQSVPERHHRSRKRPPAS